MKSQHDAEEVDQDPEGIQYVVSVWTLEVINIGALYVISSSNLYKRARWFMSMSICIGS